MLQQDPRKVVRLLQRLHARHARGAVALVAGDALAHFLVARLCGGNQQRTVRRVGRQPLTASASARRDLPLFWPPE